MNSFMIMIIHDSKASNYDSYKRSSGLNVKCHTIGVILHESYMEDFETSNMTYVHS